jgi:hypothetical protein
MISSGFSSGPEEAAAVNMFFYHAQVRLFPIQSKHCYAITITMSGQKHCTSSNPMSKKLTLAQGSIRLAGDFHLQSVRSDSLLSDCPSSSFGGLEPRDSIRASGRAQISFDHACMCREDPTRRSNNHCIGDPFGSKVSQC